MLVAGKEMTTSTNGLRLLFYSVALIFMKNKNKRIQLKGATIIGFSNKTDAVGQ